MTSAVSICNQALLRVGGQIIASLEEPSHEAILCRAFFEPGRDAVLRDYRWNFATARRHLAVKPEDPWPWGFCYGYPADCLALREIETPFAVGLKAEFEIASDRQGERVIRTNSPEAVAIYTRRVSDPGVWDPLFVEAFTWKLAADIAYPLSSTMSVTQFAMNGYFSALARARTADANEARREPDTAATWIAARTGEASPGTSPGTSQSSGIQSLWGRR